MAEEQPQMLSREQIYNEVWELSLAGVARKYGTSYGQIYKLCKETNVPIPPAGYWTKLNFGKSVSKPPLPASTVHEVAIPRSKAPWIRVQKIDKDMVTNPEAVPEVTLPDGGVLKNTYADSENVMKEDSFQEAGVNTTTIPLSQSNNSEKAIVNRTEATPKIFPGKLAFLEEDERNIIFDIASRIRIPDEKAKMHPKISAYKHIVTEWNRKDKKEVGAQRSRKSYNSYSSKSSPPFLAGVISKETLPRVYRILGALIHAIESLGCSVTDNLTFIIRNESISLEIYEMQDKIDHILTKSEENQLHKYEEDKKRYSWVSKPNFRKYDYVFNGRICICINQNKYFRDTKSSTVEEQLGDLLIEMYEASEIVRKEREAREEEQRKREEGERLREERRNRYKIEVERTIALTNLAQDYAMACKIRTFVAALESSGNLTEEALAWIDWAKKKADWYDPTIAREDEFLGKREHEKGKDSEYPWWQ